MRRFALRRVPLDVDDLVFAEADRLRPTMRVDTTGVTAARVGGRHGGRLQAPGADRTRVLDRF